MSVTPISIVSQNISIAIWQRPISRASQGCSSNFNHRQMRQNPRTPERQMLSGFWNESQFSSSLKSSVGCCRDSGIEASLHLWTDVVSDWSQFSSFHGKSLRGRTRVSRKQFRSLATWMQTMQSALCIANYPAMCNKQRLTCLHAMQLLNFKLNS